jgi:hypothetical protein
VPAEQEKPDSIPSGQQFYQLKEISVKQRLLATVVHHKYLLHADKNPHQKQSMM